MPTPPKPAAAIDPAAMSRVALKAFFAIAAEWGLTVPQQVILLGSPTAECFGQWQRAGSDRLDQAVLLRISHLLGIYAALESLCGAPPRPGEWVSRANRAFDGRSALEVMLAARELEGLSRVHEYLSAELSR